MNEKTRIYYSLSRMYEYVKDIEYICQQRNFNYESIIEDTITKHAVNMCIVQLGEHANRIKKANEEFYKQSGLSLPAIKGLRDRVTHAYGEIDYKIIKDILKNHIPKLKKDIESIVPEELLDNPYVLHEIEFDDYMSSIPSCKQNFLLDHLINSAQFTSQEPHSESHERLKAQEFEI